MSGFVYLASPYSHAEPGMREWRYKQACRAAAYLMRKGEVVFSPIAHSHPVEQIGLQTVESGAFWKRQDIPILRHASKLVVLMLDGWVVSKGLEWEIATAESLMIPVSYLDPDVLWDERNG